MKIRQLLLAAMCVGLSVTVQAQVAQRDKMKTCNAEAKATAKKGEERKAFMKSCLSTKKQDAAASGKVAPKVTKP